MSTLDPSDEQEERQPNEPQLNVNNQFPLEKEAPVKKKGEKKRPVEFIREPGKSLLPISRVQKIIKADKAFLLCLSSEIPIIAKDATFLISIATEEFIKRLSQAGHSVSEREKRSIVQHRDIEIMPWTTSDALAKRMKPNENAATLLDKFVASKGGEEAEDSGEEDIIMNEDGTMGMAIE
ncbi:hypothetical protein K443DRAFT_654003 [Laccaria amethystina LaAM-08-1]|uniref:Transcription factor CBF/NF-Y/archaeal histone domain-containing protein n=1 Tax=Laccaria amethystina LaAM-08-1 TaxID=1095629 RepID=A0A0C9Y5J3_9AGAR|nr:hypothetical protein K443DRAFT_654003 [Laccaria amethystina LaAM-08-1]